MPSLPEKIRIETIRPRRFVGMKTEKGFLNFLTRYLLVQLQVLIMSQLLIKKLEEGMFTWIRKIRVRGEQILKVGYCL